MDKLTTSNEGQEQHALKTDHTPEQSIENFYRAIADSLQCGIWVFDNALHTLYNNAAITQLLGYSTAELADKNLGDVIADQDDIARGYLNYYLNKQSPFDMPLRHKNGQIIWGKITPSRLQDLNGDSAGIVAQIEDMTQQKKAEANNITVDQNYLKVFAQFPKSGVMIYDRDLRFHKVYGSFYRTGLTISDIEGRRVEDVYPKDFVDEIIPAMRQALQGEIVVTEKQLLDRFHWLVFAPQQSIDGKITHGMILVQNITERKLTEIALRESETLYRSIFETFFDGLIVIVDGVMVDVNPAVEAMTGYQQGELVGQSPEVIVPHEWRETIRERMKNQQLERLESALLRKDGSIIPVETQAAIISYKGHTARLTALKDISEHKQLEAERLESQRIQIELEQANELRQHKDFFLSVVSHEFRTPLAVIRSSTDILERHYQRLTPEKRQTHFERVFSHIDKLTDMVGDVLLLSRSEMKGIEFLPQQCNIDSFCQDLLANLARAYPQTEVKYILDLPQKNFNVDPYLLEHILWNLLGNGAKYAPDNGQVSLRLSPTASGICFDVQDNGIGIPSADLEHIFDPFHRAGNVGTIMGTGMGLAIVKRFVELHSGVIECKSEIGKGTTFTVMISAGACDDDADSRD